MDNIEITDEITAKINGLITKVGGIDIASSITGISKVSLKKYLEKKTGIISKKVWNEKLLPFFEDTTFYKNISDRITALTGEKDECWDAFVEASDGWYKKEAELKKEMIDKKLIKEIFANPVSRFNRRILNPYEPLDNFKSTILNLKNNENYSKFMILHAMIDFKNIYEQFRPHSISSDDSYFGTVTLMDGIYDELFDYIGSERLFMFSKVAVTYIKNERNSISHKDIPWDLFIADVDVIINAIKFQMEEDSLKLLCILKDNSPYFCERLVRHFIKRIAKEDVTDEMIEFDYENDVVIVGDTKIKIDDYHRVFFELCGLK